MTQEQTIKTTVKEIKNKLPAELLEQLQIMATFDVDRTDDAYIVIIPKK